MLSVIASVLICSAQALPNDPDVLRFSPDGKYLYAGGMDGHVRVINTANYSLKGVLSNSETPRKIDSWQGHGQNKVWRISTSPSGQYIAVSVRDEINVYDSDGKHIRRIHGVIGDSCAVDETFVYYQRINSGSFHFPVMKSNVKTGESIVVKGFEVPKPGDDPMLVFAQGFTMWLSKNYVVTQAAIALRSYKLGDGSIVNFKLPDGFKGESRNYNGIDVTPDGQCVLTDSDGTLFYTPDIDLGFKASWQVTEKPKSQERVRAYCAIANDFIATLTSRATSSSNLPEAVKLWKRDGALIAQFQVGPGHLKCFDASNTHIAVGYFERKDKSQIEIYDLKGTRVRTITSSYEIDPTKVRVHGQ
jgi:WD40 repeat protein